MSGGSMDYVYGKVRDAAEGMRVHTPLRRAFRDHLLLVADALHDIEWVDSCDYGPGDEVAAIRKVFENADTPEVPALMEDARALRDALNAILNDAPHPESGPKRSEEK